MFYNNNYKRFSPLQTLFASNHEMFKLLQFAHNFATDIPSKYKIIFLKNGMYHSTVYSRNLHMKPLQLLQLILMIMLSSPFEEKKVNLSTISKKPAQMISKVVKSTMCMRIIFIRSLHNKS